MYMEKIKNVIIVALIMAIIGVMGYLLYIVITYCAYKELIADMYNLSDSNELLVYTTEVIDSKGEKVKFERPVINLDFEDVSKLNKEIEEKFKNIDFTNATNQIHVYYVENDVLYLMIRTDYTYEKEFSIYRIDTRNGKIILDNDTLLEQYYGLKIDKDKLLLQEKSYGEDITELEELYDTMYTFAISKDKLLIFKKYDTNSHYYQDLKRIELADII